MHDLAQVAVGLAEDGGDAIHQRGRRIIGDETAAHFGGDEFCGGRMRGEDFQHFFAVLDAAVGGDDVAEDDLRAVVVTAGHELEFAGLRVDAPAGEAAGDFLHVLLRVAAVDAERVQFHDLAGVVFVDAADLLRLVVHGFDGRARVLLLDVLVAAALFIRGHLVRRAEFWALSR